MLRNRIILQGTFPSNVIMIMIPQNNKTPPLIRNTRGMNHIHSIQMLHLLRNNGTLHNICVAFNYLLGVFITARYGTLTERFAGKSSRKYTLHTKLTMVGYMQYIPVGDCCNL